MFLRFSRSFRRFSTQPPEKPQRQLKSKERILKYRKYVKDTLLFHGGIAKQLGEEVANLQTPAEEETDAKVLQEIIEDRRKELEESNKDSNLPSYYKKNMLFLLAPIPLLSIGYAISEATGRMEYMPILQWAAHHYSCFNAFFLTGIDMGILMVSHSLSVNRVSTTGYNWRKMYFATIPAQASMVCFFLGPSSFRFLALCLALSTSMAFCQLWKADMPRWLMKARSIYCVVTIAFALFLAWYSTIRTEDTDQYWVAHVSPTDKVITNLKLSYI